MNAVIKTGKLCYFHFLVNGISGQTKTFCCFMLLTMRAFKTNIVLMLIRIAYIRRIDHLRITHTSTSAAQNVDTMKNVHDFKMPQHRFYLGSFFFFRSIGFIQLTSACVLLVILILDFVYKLQLIYAV